MRVESQIKLAKIRSSSTSVQVFLQPSLSQNANVAFSHIVSNTKWFPFLALLLVFVHTTLPSSVLCAFFIQINIAVFQPIFSTHLKIEAWK